MDHPIQFVATEDLNRNRLTSFFRIILAIPHLIWLAIWGIAAGIAVFISWFATLFAGQTPQALHDFIAQYMRYSSHVGGYITFLADPYPKFLGDTPYDADLAVAPPAPQNRWKTGFRGILAIPALIAATVLGYVLEVIAFISWICILFTGRIPQGLRDITLYIMRFNLQTHSYLSFLTDRYPDFSPTPR
ncbi:MAG: DUF4389 domain-containing protein [Thermoleophilia bacterium]